MTRTDFLALVTSIRAEQDKLLSEKGADYTQQSEDVLSNFKVVAEQTGQTPLEVWSVYAAKHWLAIMSYVKNGAVKSEPITGRFRDLGNYLLLGEGLLVPRGQGNLPHHHHCACVGARKPPMPQCPKCTSPMVPARKGWMCTVRRWGEVCNEPTLWEHVDEVAGCAEGRCDAHQQ